MIGRITVDMLYLFTFHCKINLKWWFGNPKLQPCLVEGGLQFMIWDHDIESRLSQSQRAKQVLAIQWRVLAGGSVT